MYKTLTATVFISVMIALNGCGGGGGGSNPPVVSSATSKGTLVKVGLNYSTNLVRLSTSPSATPVDENGSFLYTPKQKVSFYLLDYEIGSVDKVNDDGYVFLQDIVGVDRETGYNDQGVINLARILYAINDVNLSDQNRTAILNDFNVTGSVDANVTQLFTDLNLTASNINDANKTLVRNHLEYYYKLAKKTPILDRVSRITTSLYIDINSTTVDGMLATDANHSKVYVYMDGYYVGVINKDSNRSKERYPLSIKIGDESQLFNKNRDYNITFRDTNITDSFYYESPGYILTIPSPMLGRWADSNTRGLVYLKDESQLSNYTFKDINQLKDNSVAGRYLLRAGIGDINLFGTIRKLSTDTTNTTSIFKTLDMIITNVDGNITQQYRLRLKDANNAPGSIRTNDAGVEVLYVDGNNKEYIIPKNSDVNISDIRAITGQTKVYIRETDAGAELSTSEFDYDRIVGKSYDLGILNITDSTIDYNLVSKFKEGNDYLYYGYYIEAALDKAKTYTKTLEICNNGHLNISQANIVVTDNNNSIFKTFTYTQPTIDGFNSDTCKDIPLEFSFNKPNMVTDVNLTVTVTSGTIDWEDQMRLRVSDETFVKFYVLPENESLNAFIYSPIDGSLIHGQFDNNTTSYINLPRLASKDYQISITPTSNQAETPYLVGVDMIPDAKNFPLSDKNIYYAESDKNAYTIYSTTYPSYSATKTLGADTLALRYGETLDYITFGDIDYFTLDSLPAATKKYTSYSEASDISSQKNIVIPFYIDLNTTSLSFVKVYDSTTAEVTTVTPKYNEANKTVTLTNTASYSTGIKYTVKLLTGLNSSEGVENATLLKDQQWDVEFKKTNMVSTGQTTSYIQNDDGTYKSGVSMVQIRNWDNNTTTDINTRLIWQDDNDTQSIVKNFSDAKSYCTDLNTSASTSWRLPTRDELLTLVDYTTSSPAMHSSFAYTKSANYWSSTVSNADNTNSFYLDFTNGTANISANADSEYSVRCVIDSNDTNGTNFYLQSDYDQIADNKVEDRNGTYLVWQNDTQVQTVTKSWENAIGYCESLDLEGITDWRLPNIKELTTIIDDNVNNPSINVSSFKNTSNDNYWSSTTTSSNTAQAWSVNFANGTNEILDKTSSKYVRCVSRGGK